MISQQQATALRLRTIAAFADQADPAVPAASVVWAPTDLPAKLPVGVRLQLLGFATTGLEPEVQHRAAAGGLRQTTREVMEVTIAITVHSRPSSSRPHHHQAASYLARRVLLYLGTPEAAAVLARVGCPILRRGPLRDLSSLLRGSQWQSACEVQLVLAVTPLDVRDVGWIESADGTGTVTDDAGGTAVVPWSAES